MTEETDCCLPYCAFHLWDLLSATMVQVAFTFRTTSSSTSTWSIMLHPCEANTASRFETFDSLTLAVTAVHPALHLERGHRAVSILVTKLLVHKTDVKHTGIDSHQSIVGIWPPHAATCPICPCPQCNKLIICPLWPMYAHVSLKGNPKLRNPTSLLSTMRIRSASCALGKS